MVNTPSRNSALERARQANAILREQNALLKSQYNLIRLQLRIEKRFNKVKAQAKNREERLRREKAQLLKEINPPRGLFARFKRKSNNTHNNISRKRERLAQINKNIENARAAYVQAHANQAETLKHYKIKNRGNNLNQHERKLIARGAEFVPNRPNGGPAVWTR